MLCTVVTDISRPREKTCPWQDKLASSVSALALVMVLLGVGQSGVRPTVEWRVSYNMHAAWSYRLWCVFPPCRTQQYNRSLVIQYQTFSMLLCRVVSLNVCAESAQADSEVPCFFQINVVYRCMPAAGEGDSDVYMRVSHTCEIVVSCLPLSPNPISLVLLYVSQYYRRTAGECRLKHYCTRFEVRRIA